MSDRICSVPTCDGLVLARRLCSMHYRRQARHGDPMVRSAPKPPCAVEGCGRAFRAKGLCGTHYRRQYLGLPLERVANCAACGEDFGAGGDAQRRFCSRVCSVRFFRRNGSRTCSVDGCDRVHNARGLCKMHWRRVARAEGRESAPIWDERRRASKKMRLAVTRGALAAETFMYTDVYDRDGWVCGICGDAVDRGLGYPDPMSVSLDHVVPVSAGGPHVLENVQCAHLVCNLRKGDREVAGSVLSV